MACLLAVVADISLMVTILLRMVRASATKALALYLFQEFGLRGLLGAGLSLIAMIDLKISFSLAPQEVPL